jgi:hypothetical protein
MSLATAETVLAADTRPEPDDQQSVCSRAVAEQLELGHSPDDRESHWPH